MVHLKTLCYSGTKLWYIPVFPTLCRLQCKDAEFKISLSYIKRSTKKTNQPTNQQQKVSNKNKRKECMSCSGFTKQIVNTVINLYMFRNAIHLAIGKQMFICEHTHTLSRYSYIGERHHGNYSRNLFEGSTLLNKCPYHLRILHGDSSFLTKQSHIFL